MSSTPRSRRPVRRALSALIPAVAAAAGLLAACSGTPSDPGTSDPTTAAEVDAAGYPVSIDNCGTEVTLAQPPQRIVTIKSSTTELVLALGLADRLVGAAFLDSPIPAELQPDAAVTVLADTAPSSEVVLAVEPDLVFAGWESSFAADGIGERDELADLGVASYVAPAACQEDDYRPDPLTFDGVFADIIEAGDLLGAPDAAAAIVAEQQEALAQVTPSDEGLTAVWYSSGSDTPFVGGGIGAPQMIMDAVGLTNIAADIDASWGSIGWETVAAAEPDVIVLVDSAWNTADHKIEVLESNPVTAALPAVQQSRYLVVDFAATEAGIRNVAAAADLADQLAALP